MQIFELTQVADASSHRPQIERFIDDVIYVVENWDDYEVLPENIKQWRFLIMNIS